MGSMNDFFFFSSFLLLELKLSTFWMLRRQTSELHWCPTLDIHTHAVRTVVVILFFHTDRSIWIHKMEEKKILFRLQFKQTHFDDGVSLQQWEPLCIFDGFYTEESLYSGLLLRQKVFSTLYKEKHLGCKNNCQLHDLRFELRLWSNEVKCFCSRPLFYSPE